MNIGPFIDDTDGKTAETGAVTDDKVKVAKNGGDYAAKNETTDLTHDNEGWYHCNLDQTDTGTLGRLQLHCHEAGFLPVFHEYMVLPANVYDSLVSGSASDYLTVDVVQLGGVTQSATDLKDFADDGYDPATNKVEGVKLADTTTTNTDMITAAVVNTQCDTALSDIGLDHLVQTDIGAGKPADGTLFDQIMNKGAGQTFDATTDSLEALVDVGVNVATQSNIDFGALQKASLNAATPSVTVSDKTGFSLSAAGIDSIVDEAVEGAITWRQAARLILASLTGKTSEAVPGTLVIRDANDLADRITATMDANRYRTGVVLNP